MKKIIGIFLCAIMIVSCGPSKEELDAQKERAKITADSISTALIKVLEDSTEPEVKETTSNRLTFYNASDFKLVPGKIIKWAPSDDAVIDEGFKTDKFFKCWVHLQQEDGSVKVMEVDEFAWRNLYTGDILK